MIKHISRGAAVFAVLTAGTVTAFAATVSPKPAGGASPMMVVETPVFLKMVTGSNQFEIQSSQLATEKASGTGVKELADLIIADHTKAEQKLDATLEGKGEQLAAAPPAPKQQKMLDQLKAAEGKDFEMLYLDMQAQAHMEAIGLFRTYAGSGDDQEVVGFAKETLPRLEMHLAHVKKLVAAD